MRFEAVMQQLSEATEPMLVVHPDLGAPDRVALLSGSFDPMTLAHGAVADAAAARADAVVFVYAVRPLPKEGLPPEPLLSAPDRLSILDRYCRSRPGFAVGICSHGLLAEQTSAARARFPNGELRLVLGSDKVLQLLDPKWYTERDPTLGKLFAEARVLHVPRGEEEAAVEEALTRPENLRWRHRFERLKVPEELASISSRLVRNLVRQAREVRHLVPPEVHSLLPRHRPHLSSS